MGLRDWLGRVFGRTTPDPARDAGAAGDGDVRDDADVDAADDAGDPGAIPPTAVPAAAAPRASARPAPTDPLAQLRGLAPSAAIPRAIEELEATRDATVASRLLAWLRDAVSDPALHPEARVRLADFFAARAEPAIAERALRPVVERGDASALPALMRLADLAHQDGRLDDLAATYEEILAIDVGYPGARERLARLRAPARAGGAGATLMSPEAAKLAQGRFALVRELGRGGAGAVFLARDARGNRDVALKIYHPASRADRGARLRAEARVAASLASRHVIRVYDLFEDLGGLSTEFCPGGALRAAIARGEGTAAQRRAWARGVAHALAVTHDRGWVHRDLKPGNVLLRADGAAVLTDFGLARRAGATIEPHEGTTGYVAPEVRARLVADPRLDVYAFGALARELLGDAAPELAGLVRAALSSDPDARPRDGAALLRALDDAGTAAP